MGIDKFFNSMTFLRSNSTKPRDSKTANQNQIRIKIYYKIKLTVCVCIGVNYVHIFLFYQIYRNDEKNDRDFFNGKFFFVSNFNTFICNGRRRAGIKREMENKKRGLDRNAQCFYFVFALQ